MIGAIAASYVVGAASYQSLVMAKSPVAYWRLDDASGTTAVDASGNGKNGTYSGSYSLSASGLLTTDANKAVDFSGGYMSAGFLPDAGSALTVEAIIKADTVPGSSFAFIVSRDLNGSNGPWWLVLHNGKLELALWSQTTGVTQLSGGTTIVPGTKYHVVGRYNGTTMSVYVNGVLDGSVAKTGALKVQVQDVRVGNWPGASLPFDGIIDEVAVYHTALSTPEIAAHYAAA